MKWTAEREQELRDRWAIDPSRVRIARAMGITMGSISGKSRRLNLHYPPTGRALVLSDHHRAVIEARSLFRGQLREPSAGETVLKSGANQRKLGSLVTKGHWRGMPIFSLSLEERATCPRDCAVFSACYGNGMAHAVRYQHGTALEKKIWSELEGLQRRHRCGFVVRLHILGDFYSTDYVAFWEKALRTFPALRVFGYTARQVSDPIGRQVADLRNRMWSRFAVRTSGAPRGPRTLVIDSDHQCTSMYIVCPAQTGRTQSCGTCSLCWASKKPVAFLRH